MPVVQKFFGNMNWDQFYSELKSNNEGQENMAEQLTDMLMDQWDMDACPLPHACEYEELCRDEVRLRFRRIIIKHWMHMITTVLRTLEQTYTSINVSMETSYTEQYHCPGCCTYAEEKYWKLMTNMSHQVKEMEILVTEINSTTNTWTEYNSKCDFDERSLGFNYDVDADYKFDIEGNPIIVS